MCKFRKRRSVLALLLWIVPGSRAQEESCYGSGSIAASVIITVIVTVFLLYVLYVLWKRYWRDRKGKHLVLETDPEKGKNAYAFDNAGFTDTTSPPMDRVMEKTNKSKWSSWSPLGALMTKNEKQKTLDDSALQVHEVKTVALKSHDFTGLGFNIYGNMRDGIYIKDILHRGPASESGKLNLGDRIKSVTINFDHVVYEDALTILSYASPYDVVLEAQSGKMVTNHTPTKTVQLGHPLYRSSSAADLIQIQKSTKKRLFPTDDLNASTVSSAYSSLQKTCSTATTLERTQSQSSKPEYENIMKTTKAQASSPQNLKLQLEQKIFQNHKQQLKAKDDHPRPESTPPPEAQKIENKYQKFGIKVLPVELKSEPPRDQSSPKNTELSQNDNNINLERHSGKFSSPTSATPEESRDEVDQTEQKNIAPPVKKREKNKSTEDLVKEPKEPETFIRQGSTGGSGIKRDKDGIPQEIPSHMLNAAVAARKHRRPSETSEDIKSPKKPKGRAPAPPDPKSASPPPGIPKTELKLNFDEIRPVEENQQPVSAPPAFEQKPSKDAPDYVSDSDMETDNQSSVNTIELNASDITIHQTEDTEEIQNRRTASTGDLTKIQKTRKTSTGTLERAQSLDITDTTMPTLSKKRKGGSIEGNFDSKSGSDDSLYGKALVHKEPRLSLALDGLNTFQRSRLKKSTEWGNLEDAILSLDMDETDHLNQHHSLDNSAHVDALVNKINEIKLESHAKTPANTPEILEERTAIVFGSISPKETTPVKTPALEERIVFEPNTPVEKTPSEALEGKSLEKTTITFDANKPKDEFNTKLFLVQNQPSPKIITNGDTQLSPFEVKHESLQWPTFETQNGMQDEPKDPKVYERGTNSVFISPVFETTNSQKIIPVDEKPSKPSKLINLLPSPVVVSESFLVMERNASDGDPFYNSVSKIYDTNVPDDIKVSRHSLGSLEKSEEYQPLSTSITISNRSMDNQGPGNEYSSLEININDTSNHPVPEENDTLYTTALDTTLKNNRNDSSLEYEKVSISSPTIISDSSDTVTIEGPTSLTLEINDDSSKIREPQEMTSPVASMVTVHQDHSPKSNYSLTYITEIQVLTPNNNAEEAENSEQNQKFENYLKNFESNIKNFESHIQTGQTPDTTFESQEETAITIDPEKELHKIQELAEEQLKKLPEMRFSTSSYESPKVSENSTSQIEQLRSNFEKPPAPKTPTKTDATKSRIPVATTKTPPTSPERRDSRNFDLEVDKEIVAIMSSPIHSTPIQSSLKYPKIAHKNVSVTSIRSNSKIPSGLPGSRPPVPPRRYDTGDSSASTNGSASSFKQWVFNPDDNTVTNITVTENKLEHK